MTKTLVDIICEVISVSNSSLVQEPVVRAFLLLAGQKCEEKMAEGSGNAIKNIRNLIGKLPVVDHQNPLAMKLDDMVDICLSVIPRKYHFENSNEISLNS